MIQKAQELARTLIEYTSYGAGDSHSLWQVEYIMRETVNFCTSNYFVSQQNDMRYFDIVVDNISSFIHSPFALIAKGLMESLYSIGTTFGPPGVIDVAENHQILEMIGAIADEISNS